MNNLPNRKPEWLKAKSNTGTENSKVMELIHSYGLHTVCEEANCPNIGECFGRRTATFMILGKYCTRNCRFCNVLKGQPTLVDTDEPMNIVNAIRNLGLQHVVITSVTRDDLSDGGASHFANVIRALRDSFKEKVPVIEVLIPDFQGNCEALERVIEATPDIISHNIETVPRLYPSVRPLAIYKRSLDVIKRVRDASSKIITKSGMMVGLGETAEEIYEVFNDLISCNCDILTIGQYLAPSKMHHEVIEYIHPDKFMEFKIKGEKLGIKYIASGPLVRSSYMADEAYNNVMKCR